jgi:predicted SAM-dependent methyltransferase
MRVLNVGGGNKAIAIPGHFDGWEHQMLDIDPNSGADVICSALEIPERLAEKGYDAVYCSHNLEHYYRHDIPKVLAGFIHVLEDDGFIQIKVPNMTAVFEAVVKDGKDIGDVLYASPAGPITALDMIYGYDRMIEESGNDFMCHKTGFTAKSLGNTLGMAGLKYIFVGNNGLELIAFAFKNRPTEYQMKVLNLRESAQGEQA